MPLAVIVHGGAGNIADQEVEPHRRGVKSAAQAAWQILTEGGAALDAVQAAILVLEDDPAFDAGTGSFLNRDGQVEMDASIMDGRTLDAGAVAGVQHIKNPILLARQVLASDFTFLIGRGAERFAQECGMPLVANRLLRTREQILNWKEYKANPPGHPEPAYVSPQGTVGCVAVDRHGNVAAGTSTGGTRFKYPGRVGDSPLIGCATYADNQSGGASTTGWGEAITRVVLSKSAVDALARGAKPSQAARDSIEYLARRVGGTGGIIVANPLGHVGFSFNTPRMARAYITEELATVLADC